jgi:hypothetical protein
MTISTQVCALCNKQLGTKYPAGATDGTKFYTCSTHIPGTKLSHYYVEKVGNVLFQIIQIPPFVIVNCSATENTDIYPYSGNGSRILTRKKILSIPRIPVTTADKLIEKIKTYIVFS